MWVSNQPFCGIRESTASRHRVASKVGHCLTSSLSGFARRRERLHEAVAARNTRDFLNTKQWAEQLEAGGVGCDPSDVRYALLGCPQLSATAEQQTNSTGVYVRQYKNAKFIQVLPAGQARDDAFWPPRAPRARRALLPDAVRNRCLEFVVTDKARRSGRTAEVKAQAARAKSPPPDARATRRSAPSTSPQPPPAEAKAQRASALLRYFQSTPWVRNDSKDGAKVSFLRLSRNADSVVVGVDASVDGDGIAMTVTLCGRPWDVESRKCSPVDLGPRTVDCATFLSLMVELGTGRTCCGVEKEDLSENLRDSFVEATEVAIRGGAREVATSRAGSWALGRRAARGPSRRGPAPQKGGGRRWALRERRGVVHVGVTRARGLGCARRAGSFSRACGGRATAGLARLGDRAAGEEGRIGYSHGERRYHPRRH